MKKYILMLLLLAVTMASTQEEQFLRLELTGGAKQMRHYIELQFGTPPQKLMFTVDTGSEVLTTNCWNCQSEVCRQTKLPNYNPEISQTSATIPCSKTAFDCSNKCSARDQKPCLMVVYYGDYTSEYKGNVYQDEIDFVTKATQEGRSFTAPFICSTYSAKGKFFAKSKENGILGLGPNSLYNPLYYWFSQKKYNEPKIFSLCLADEGGFLQVGTDPDIPEPQVKVTLPYNPKIKSTYSVSGVKKIYFGDRVLISEKELNAAFIILDNGTPMNVLPLTAYQQIINSLQSICSMNLITCKDTEQMGFYFIIDISLVKEKPLEFLDKFFPAFTINYGSVNTTILPRQYMYISMGEVAFTAQLLFQPSSDSKIVLGHVWFRNQRVTFDLQNNQVTIVPNSDCTFQRQSLNYRTLTPGKTIITSYFILLIVLVFACFGSKLCYRCSKLKNRFRKKPAELVEERLPSSGPVSATE